MFLLFRKRIPERCKKEFEQLSHQRIFNKHYPRFFFLQRKETYAVAKYSEQGGNIKIFFKKSKRAFTFLHLTKPRVFQYPAVSNTACNRPQFQAPDGKHFVPLFFSSYSSNEKLHGANPIDNFPRREQFIYREPYSLLTLIVIDF